MDPTPIKEELEALLRKLGLKSNSLYRIRFGGVVGKIALLGFAALLAVAVVAWKSADPYTHWGCLAAIALVGLPGMGAILYFGHKHPLEATLEGGEIVALKGLESQFAAKDFTQIPDQPPVARTLEIHALKPPTEGGNA